MSSLAQESSSRHSVRVTPLLCVCRTDAQLTDMRSEGFSGLLLMRVV